MGREGACDGERTRLVLLSAAWRLPTSIRESAVTIKTRSVSSLAMFAGAVEGRTDC